MFGRGGWRPSFFVVGGSFKGHREKGKRMYKGQKVYDIHGHVTAPDAARGFVTMLLGSNTAMAQPAKRRRAAE